jgi:hypothetical protein
VSEGFLAFMVFFWVVCGAVAALIASNKHVSAAPYFFAGLLLGHRCTVRQHVFAAATQADCWQCKTEWSLVHDKAVVVGAGPGWYRSRDQYRWWDGHKWADWAK